MAKTDANPPMPEFRTDYALVQVDADYLAKAVKPKQFIHIDQSECIMCEGCVDICPCKCIHMVRPDAIAEWSPVVITKQTVSDSVAVGLYGMACVLTIALWALWQGRGDKKTDEIEKSTYGRPLVKA